MRLVEYDRVTLAPVAVALQRYRSGAGNLAELDRALSAVPAWALSRLLASCAPSVLAALGGGR